MTTISTGTYIEVPPETCSEASCPSLTPPSPFAKGVGGRGVGNSLGNVVGLTDTITKVPSDLAFEALSVLHGLDNADPRKQEQSVCNKLYEYLLSCENKMFRLKGFDTKEGKFVIANLDYNNRWSPRYRKELSKKLDLLENWFRDATRNLTFISLTGAQSGISRREHWNKLNDSRIKLLKILKRNYREVQYIWVTEPHMENDTGYVHYHLVVFADVSNNIKDKKTGEGMEDKLRRLWSEKYKTGSHTYGLDFKQPKEGMEVKNLKNYLIKYLRKSTLLGEWTPGMLIYNALMWDTGHRAFGASKQLREIMKIPDNTDKNTVWLETKTVNEEGGEKIVWYRQYIPDWLDCDVSNTTDKIYIFDWGRKIGNDWENRVYEYKSKLRNQKETGIYYECMQKCW